MTFQDFLASIGVQSEFSFWALIIFLTSIGVEIIPSFKWNPWSSLFKWIGSKLNTHIDARLESVQNDIKTVRGEIKAVELKVDNVQDELSKHKAESEMKALEDTRRDILDFCNACMNGRKHTKEQYAFMMSQCDKYKIYIHENDVQNGVIEAAMDEIDRLYHERLRKNDFLREGEDPEEHIRKSIIEEVIKEVHKLYDGYSGRKQKTGATADEVLQRAKAARSVKKISESRPEEKGEAIS